MIGVIYNLLLWLALPLLLPYHAYRSLSRGRRTAFLERFGRIPAQELDLVGNGGTILVHAVSVGETNAALPLLKGIRKRFPGKKIVISNVTETGRSVAQKSNAADLCIYFPFDYPFAVRSILKSIDPELVVIMETEIWPNFIGVARDMGIPVLLANGRISDRSFGRYLRLSWFFRPVLQRLAALCMQTPVDAERICAIGAPSSAVHVGGNLKYDIPVLKADQQQVAAIKEKYGIPADCFVFAAASTHEGEEAQVLAAYRELVRQTPQSFLILAPRHPERAAGVGELVKKEGFPFRFRSALKDSERLVAGGILLLDTVGELAGLYRACDLVFVGGSLVPTGGHNPLEPAACMVPVLFGPHMENFREIEGLFLKHGGPEVQVADAQGLTTALLRLAADPSGREEAGRRAAGILLESAGATERHLDVMAGLLGEGRQRG
ncbi:3-deoxy-D-manno-octulosonic acid transferase [Geomonas agri]|uniref:3-deoxy-D-manno-octulosonic acid transferase n=1 Tax=Geomonas agri TaxID=2873702 RepID=UPI001CD7C287|nr:3-deoxy-D-manno-octulosonic acid transferase [Geomonas agri]